MGDATARRSPNNLPLDTKKGALPSAEPLEVATAKSCLPLFRGRDPDSTRWIDVFILFNYLFSLLN
jgi:hypothetical protein